MKLPIVSLLALASLCLSFSEHKTFVPPGTVKINDTLFADRTEVSNLAWLEYEQWTKQTYGAGSKEHVACLPDTLVWRQKLSYNEPYVLYYYRHPAYRNYPVVGISYEQAVAYCAWRTEYVRSALSKQHNANPYDLTYRLPDKHEWEALAQSNLEAISKGGKDKKGRLTIMCVNPSYKGDCLYGKYSDVMAPVEEFPKNALGLFNMSGNVAEMVMEKGICKGGGWKNALDDCRPAVDAHYSDPTSWIGFRCVCVVKKSS